MPRPKTGKIRLQLAQRAARLMAEGGIASFAAAKEKAAGQLGVDNLRSWPDNKEIQAALSEYQRLFRGTDHHMLMDRLRRAALEAMRALAAFQPRLVGAVLDGTASEHTTVNLHVFSDPPERFCQHLLDSGIPFVSGERQLKINLKTTKAYPAFRFIAGDTHFEVVVFPPKGIRQSPLSPVDEKPMRRADRAMLESLLSFPL